VQLKRFNGSEVPGSRARVRRRGHVASASPRPTRGKPHLRRVPDDGRVGAHLRRTVAIALVCLLAAACAGSPTQPHSTSLPTGRWTGDGPCLSVAADVCDLVVGCGHGQFSPPVVRADGTFEVSGTYRIEVGPVSIDPAPPAMFSGVLKGQTLTITVTPSDPSLRPATYVLQLTNGTGKCSVPCL